MRSLRLAGLGLLLTSAAGSLATTVPPAGAVREVKEGTLDSSGVPIYYRVRGQGPPLLLLHGFAADSSLYEQMGIAPALARKFEVISMDCRGHGKSGKPHDPAQYGVQMIEDIIVLLDHLQIEQTRVFGYSMGGMLTLKLLTTEPDRVLAAVVGGYGWAEDLEDMAAVAEALEKGEGFGPLFGELEVGEVLSEAERAQQKAIEQQLLARSDPLALAAAARGFQDLAVTEAELRACEIPVLALIGGDDALKADVDRMVGVLPHLTVKVLPGKDHLNAPAAPEFLPALQEFLSR